MGTRFAGLFRKEIAQFFRDRVMLVVILWLYTVEVILCTLSLSFDLHDLPLAVVDSDRSPSSRALVSDMLNSEIFALAGELSTEQAAEEWLQSGRARAALLVPVRFGRDLAAGEAPAVQVLVDGTNSNVAAQARGYALAIAARFQATESGGVTPATRIWFNPAQTHTSFMVLSMVALAALMVGVFHPVASIVREREAGTIEQLRVTPIRLPELFAAKTLPTLIMGVISVFPSLVIIRMFGVPFRGSLLLFLGMTAEFLLSAIALGVLVASVSRTLQQGLLLSFFGLFPLMFLSGTIAPVESMPHFLQTLSLGSPMRHYLDIVLAISLKGSTFTDIWPHAAALAAIGIPLFGIAALIFRRSAA